jgi:hypothetical protein
MYPKFDSLSCLSFPSRVIFGSNPGHGGMCHKSVDHLEWNLTDFIPEDGDHDLLAPSRNLVSPQFINVESVIPFLTSGPFY